MHTLVAFIVTGLLRLGSHGTVVTLPACAAAGSHIQVTS